MRTIDPPRSVLSIQPEATPIDVTEEEYVERDKRLWEDCPAMSPGEHDQHLDHILHTIARPGKIMAPGTLTDPTQVANAFLTDSAHTREVFRGVTALHIDEAKAIQAAVADGTLTLRTAVESAVASAQARADKSDAEVSAKTEKMATGFRELTEQGRDSSAQLTAGLQSATKAISDGIGAQSVVIHDTTASLCDQIRLSAGLLAISLTSLAQAVNGAETQDAARYRISARDRWIQTGILTAGLFAVVGAILRGVL